MSGNSRITVGAIAAAIGIALGAFAAHSLKATLDDYQLGIFETGVRYQMYHALALVAVGLAGDRLAASWANAACWSFVAGIVLFCGSLYLMALTGARWPGPITPIGGVFLILGWISFAVAAAKSRPSRGGSF